MNKPINKDKAHQDIGKQKFRVRNHYTCWVEYDVVANSKEEAEDAVRDHGGLERIEWEEGYYKDDPVEVYCSDWNHDSQGDSDYEKYGLHEADSIFLAFAKLTKSTLVTCDKELLRCCSLAQCEFIEFQGFLEKVCQPSPITKMLRDRRNYRRNQYKKLRKYQHHDRWGIRN